MGRGLEVQCNKQCDIDKTTVLKLEFLAIMVKYNTAPPENSYVEVLISSTSNCGLFKR